MTWLREISFGMLMTMLDLWYFNAKSFKNFAGGNENGFAIANATTKIANTWLARAMS
jgi:hypothetical protein